MIDMMRKQFHSLCFAFLALSLSASLPAFAQSTSDSAPVRAAIVGLEHGHVDGFLGEFTKHPDGDVKLVAIVDANPQLRQQYETRYHLPHSLFYANLDQMIAAQHPQALLVYTPISEHRQVIEAAAAKGVNVMVEKPLTLSLADALAIRQAAREHHIQVLVNYETTWYPTNRKVYDMVEDGQLGTIYKVVVHDGHQGPKEIGVNPTFMSWLDDPAKNGAGALYDFGCYGADLMTWLMHGEAPISVTAVAQTDKPGEYPHVDDDATIILRYPHTQAVLMPSWDWSFARKDMAVYGSKGDAITVNADDMQIRLRGQQEAQATVAPPLPQGEDSSLHYLAAVLRGQIKAQGDLTALDTNMVVMQILNAARESARTGRTILLKPLPQ
jgi:glucose-fructose oxidoreductase